MKIKKTEAQERRATSPQKGSSVAGSKRKKVRRSDLKILTKEGAVLKYLRESRKLSVRKAAKIVGLSDTKISHSENGRCDLNPAIILKCLNAYGY